jgi:Mg-chelatase subunit ChlD
MRSITKSDNTNSNNKLVQGSLTDIAQKSGKSLAETFINCDVVILVDTSGSMAITDSRGGNSRYDVACEELTALQGSLPGKIAVLSFSSDVMFCPSGVPIFFTGCTNMAKALQFAKIADAIEGMRFILISDGEPDFESETLTVAKSYKNKIDTIYVGPEERPTGREFLNRLSKASGGKTITADRAKELKSGIEKLLLNSGY